MISQKYPENQLLKIPVSEVSRARLDEQEIKNFP